MPQLETMNVSLLTKATWSPASSLRRQVRGAAARTATWLETAEDRFSRPGDRCGNGGERGRAAAGDGGVVDGWKEAIPGYPRDAHGRTQSDELDPQHKSTRLPPRSLISTPHDLRPCQWALAAPARRWRNGRASFLIAPQSSRRRSSAGRILRAGPALAAPLRGRPRPSAGSYARSSPGVRRSPPAAWRRFVWC